MFYDILERKNASLGYKNNKFKKSKNRCFSKGVDAWFSSKIGHFPMFFFKQYRPRKCVLRYPITKKRLLAIKTSLKSRKIDIFPKGLTHGFGQKLAIFQFFYFRQYRRGYFFLRYSRTKKRLSRNWSRKRSFTKLKSAKIAGKTRF